MTLYHLIFLGYYRLERKEDEALGEAMQALQYERDRCKSLENQVWAMTIYPLNICAGKTEEVGLMMGIFVYNKLTIYEHGVLFNYLYFCVP